MSWGMGNVGGGSGLGSAFAVIAVSYPAGSTCTCTKGARTLRAKDTSGAYLFAIPEAGTWTVSCTYGTNTATETVVITTKYQFFSAILSYDLLLYCNGAIENYTFAAYGDTGTHTISDEGEYLQLTIGRYVSFGFWCEQMINPTEYSTLNITFFDATGVFDLNRQKFGLSSTTGDNESNFSAYTSFNNFSGTKTLTVDISNVSTSQYVRARGLTENSGTGGFTAKISKIWLSKGD